MCDPWKRVWAWLLLYWASQPDPNNCLVSCLLPHVEEPRATLSTPGLPRLCLQGLQLWTPLRPTRSGHGAAQPVAVVDISSNPPVRQVLPSPLHPHHSPGCEHMRLCCPRVSNRDLLSSPHPKAEAWADQPSPSQHPRSRPSNLASICLVYGVPLMSHKKGKDRNSVLLLAKPF